MPAACMAKARRRSKVARGNSLCARGSAMGKVLTRASSGQICSTSAASWRTWSCFGFGCGHQGPDLVAPGGVVLAQGAQVAVQQGFHQAFDAIGLQVAAEQANAVLLFANLGDLEGRRPAPAPEKSVPCRGDNARRLRVMPAFHADAKAFRARGRHSVAYGWRLPTQGGTVRVTS